MNIVKQSVVSESPFNAIRHFDESGNEFWMATELLKMLGYKTWKRIQDTVIRAQVACKNSQMDSTLHFADVVQMAQIGDSVATREVVRDYKLSRYACYLVAMNGDPRKPEIAMAQTYFAVKAHEAETVIPAQNEHIRELELRLKIAELEKATSDNHLYLEGRREFILDAHGPQMLALIQGRPDVVVEKIETVTETVVCQGDRRVSFVGRSTAEIGKDLGFPTGKKFEQWLERQGRSDLVCQGLRAVQAPYVPTENLAEVKRLWAQNRKSGDRQMLIGE